MVCRSQCSNIFLTKDQDVRLGKLNSDRLNDDLELLGISLPLLSSFVVCV